MRRTSLRKSFSTNTRPFRRCCGPSSCCWRSIAGKARCPTSAHCARRSSTSTSFPRSDTTARNPTCCFRSCAREHPFRASCSTGWTTTMRAGNEGSAMSSTPCSAFEMIGEPCRHRLRTGGRTLRRLLSRSHGHGGTRDPAPGGAGADGRRLVRTRPGVQRQPRPLDRLRTRAGLRRAFHSDRQRQCRAPIGLASVC